MSLRYTPEKVVVEGFDLYKVSVKDALFEHVNSIFGSTGAIRLRKDPEMNPPKRVAELSPGYETGSVRNLEVDKSQSEIDVESIQFVWDMEKNQFERFLRIASKEELLRDCNEIAAFPTFHIKPIDEKVIESIRKNIEFISATAYVVEEFSQIRLSVRACINLQEFAQDQIREITLVLEKAIEYLFLFFKGFSATRRLCFLPSIGKIVSIDIIGEPDLIGQLNSNFRERMKDGLFEISPEISEILSLLSYDDNGFPSLIHDGTHNFHFLWRGGLVRDGTLVYLINLSDKKDLLKGRMKHTLPTGDNRFLAGTSDLMGDILYGISLDLLNWMFLEEERLQNVETLIRKFGKNTIASGKVTFTKEEGEAIKNLIRLESGLIDVRDSIRTAKKIESVYNYSFFGSIYAPELPIVNPLKVGFFDMEKVIRHTGQEYPITFSKSLELDFEESYDKLNKELEEASADAKHYIELYNSGVQIKTVRWSYILLILTFGLFVVAVLGILRGIL